ncbi:polymorphic toxin-type HINT domain-containing protein [Streptomyces sp. AJ-1]|uniref:polymorphic toxin-type HINT domain-containing protein n=1 Tax=Streptomyces sp. AJ-1 TaxID=3044384 RepID=UPI00249B9A4E|nr:polymorphic toxin-type HINT domain-containing protein [Streptomyces sp. AJ-1]MDI3342299.1 polymorphic toxin-type HINT domain-containing protein [Streptomyces sp. AJ-1]
MHDRGVQPALIDDTGYTYDDAGNLTSIKRTPGQGMPDGQAGPDTQCFVYDQLRRMTSAWTAADDTCTGGPGKTTVGGDQPYWHSYTFDDSGNRTALTEHDPAGNTAKDIKRTYSYGGEAGGPNRLAEVASEGPGGTTRSVYGYDKAGNTTTRQHNGTTQTLKWDPEGALTEVSEPVEGGTTKTTKYLNDASGERLLRHGPDGSTTLYLGETELTAKPDGTTTTERFYSHPDGLFFPILVGIAARIAIRAAIRADARAAAKRAARIAARKAAQRRARALAKARARAAAKARAKARREAARKRAAAARAAAKRAAAAARQRAQRAAAKRAQAARAAARKARANKAPKAKAKPKSQPKPKSKPSQKSKPTQRKTNKVKEEAREQTKDAVSEEAQAQSCEVNSFVPGTKVLMADGSKKPIEDVRTGDKVLATDPKTGETKPQPVAATIIGKGDKTLVTVTIRTTTERAPTTLTTPPPDGSVPVDATQLAPGEDGEADEATSTIVATDGHPFWVPELNTWLDAGQLQPGQWLHTSAGTWVQITAVFSTTQRATVHNLTVADVHTYHVVAGGTSALVHNCSTPDERAHARASENAAYSSRPDVATGGYLWVQGHGEFDLASDRLHPLIRANRGAIPAAASPGGGQFFGSHVEVQAATIMRILAKQSGSGGLSGRLMVSKPGGPCSFCAPNVAGMLPGNSSLVVRFQRGRVFGEVTF